MVELDTLRYCLRFTGICPVTPSVCEPPVHPSVLQCVHLFLFLVTWPPPTQAPVAQALGLLR